MIVGSYGVGFLIAARDPYRHWPVVLVGFVGKLIGPSVFLLGLSTGTLPAKLGWTILTNDLIWLVPFLMMLWGDGEEFFAHYGMDDVPRISEPKCRLDRQFGLDLGGFSQLFGLRVWLRGIVAGLINGHGIGRAGGNTFQMPGVFTYHCRQVLEGYQHERASDRPDYVELATRATQTMPEATAV